MKMHFLQNFLLWCMVFNAAMLFWWFFLFVFAHDLLYRLHTKWFKISPEQFDAIHYAGIAFYKILIILFNVVPFLALWIVR
jgi:hypothetical protein